MYMHGFLCYEGECFESGSKTKINVNDFILSLNYSSFFLTEMRPEDPETKSRWNKS